MFSCTLPKVADFQIFLLTRHEFYGNLSQQFNITYLLRVSARLLKEPEQVFNFLSLHNEPEPRPSRKGWSGLGCCVAFFYCQIQHRTLTTERPSAWDTRRWPRKGEPENAAGRGQESHAGRTARSASCVQNEHMRRNGRLSTRWGRRNQCGQIVHIDSVRATLNLDLTFCQATVKSGKCRFPVFARLL